mmetsp:Transcript_27487/g.44728  ORF Transcript_27487/g.44728 Transcript_27487/m.44728 type:complete len:146 (+) Transcript_27487:110-547(+)|eukprot:CAMPEP_0184672346 /NCGR_PEP_ID=MMETSP0308-20130426/86036_1 /TAXON_ID=38269 /ORGANISM="Gloeochaete witrockiana, Strain SAG 46.84" /LENGTH=145 /DNA_ID=CAMNT_0027119665 /DNA_START=36 /DNA_END=473 /DNA_ORIENTATION=+
MEDVNARKERLRALREAKALAVQKPDGDSTANGGNAEDDDQEHPIIKFRNYVPRDADLRELKQEAPKLPSVDEQIAAVTAHHTKPTLESSDSVLNIAIKKPNWDLKRDVAKRLEKLNRRTQKAIEELRKEEEEQSREEEDNNEDS